MVDNRGGGSSKQLLGDILVSLSGNKGLIEGRGQFVEREHLYTACANL